MHSSIDFPRHDCGLYLEHNPHRDFYMPVKEWIEDYNHIYDWGEDEKSKAIETDEVWTLQWYPDTPVGSYSVAASTLEKVLEMAHNIDASLR